MRRRYRNLILTCGTHESSNVPDIVVAGMFEDGFDTPREILQAFRDTLMEMIKELVDDEVAGKCSKCTHRTRSPMARYCEFCGKPLRLKPDDLPAFAAARFREWFEQQVHQFADWEFLSDRGWEVTRMVTGGYVALDGFDGCLEEWAPEDYEDNLGEDRTWWDSLELTTGELIVDKED